MDDQFAMKTEQPNLSNLADDEWFSDRKNSSFWLRIYTSLGLSHKDFVPEMEKITTKVERTPPLKIDFGRFVDLEVPVFRVNMYATENGITNIDIHSDNHKLIRSNYVLFATPYKIDGVPGNELATKSYLNKTEALIVLHMGRNFLRSVVADGEVHAADGKFNLSSQLIKLPQPAEGPFLHKQNWDDFDEIKVTLATLQIEIRNRIELSLEFFERAIRADDGFFDYWTSLEILCNGKEKKIRSKMQNCYKLKDIKKDVDDQSGFGVIAAWRHALVHDGVRPQVSSDAERYIQLLYLDLLRQELDLPPRNCIKAMQQAIGYDLSPLGLMDNRTEEQKNKPKHQ
jgi:hypothetical protein